MSKAQIEDCLVYETYELIFNHYLNINGERVKIDEPIKTSIYIHQDFNRPKSYIVNDMLYRLKEYLVKEIEAKENE